MFSDNQMTKIKIFASMAKITNECFKTCITDFSIKTENNTNKNLEPNETKCIQNCADSYSKLRNFLEGQLFADYESIKKKNEKIYDEQT
jgi:hypothetical protein